MIRDAILIDLMTVLFTDAHCTLSHVGPMHHIAHAAAAAEVQGGQTTITVVLSILISKRNQCHVQRTGLHNNPTWFGRGSNLSGTCHE